MRRFLRAVGYGYRPWPAILTYMVLVLGLSGLLYRYDDGSGCGKFVDGPYTFGDQIIRVLLLPISTLRLDFGGATSYAPIGCHAGLHTLAFAVSGLVLGFVVVAIRNYMRTPTKRQG